MLVAERQSMIVELIHENGSVQVDELAKTLNVSPMTIRRDLVKLQEDGVIERCHGGAVIKQEVTYADKQISHKDEKKALARACLAYAAQGDTIYLDAGTTTYEIARVIQSIPDIMVATNDLEIARLLKDGPAEIILCGGSVQKSTGSMFGYYALQMIQDFQFDLGFFGAASIDEEFQVLTPTIDKAFLKREARKRCGRSYLVVDESKFDRKAMTRINHLGEYTGVVTNRIFTDEETKKLAKLNANIVHVAQMGTG